MFIIQWSIPLMISQISVCDIPTVQNYYSDPKKFSYHWRINNYSTKQYTSMEQPLRSPQVSFLKGIPFDLNCTTKSDCEIIDKNMNCFKNVCYCEQNYIYIYSNEKRCFKKDKYIKDSFFKGTQKSKADEIYTAALVAVSCIMVAVTCILIACVVKKSSQLRNYQHRNTRNGQPNDVFTIADEIAAVRAADKPPTYEEVMRNEEMQYGVPPPDYPSSSILPQLDTAIILPGPSHLNTSADNIAPNETENVDNESSNNFHQLPSFSCIEHNEQININDDKIESVNQENNEITIVINHTNIDVNIPGTSEELSEQMIDISSTDESSEAYTNLAFETDI